MSWYGEMRGVLNSYATQITPPPSPPRDPPPTSAPSSSSLPLTPPTSHNGGCLPPSPITPEQRRRMETNRKNALFKRQQMQQRKDHPSSPLSVQQAEILRAVAEGRSVFITGSAGTGKSFLLEHAIRLLRQTHPPDSVFVTASTGVAACAIGGQTLHSFAGIGLGRGEKDALLHRAAGKEATVQRWRRARALVVDEISMIDGELFDALEYIARTIGGVSEEAWGGIQLVVSGDFFQLPPINAPNPAKEFAFEADCWDASFDLQVELTRVFRQSDSRLIDLLQGIRWGRNDDVDLQLQLLLGAAAGPSAAAAAAAERADVTRLFPRNEDVRRVNNERLRRIGKTVLTYVAEDHGEEPWLGQLRQGIAPDALEICLGARVMLIKNTDPMAGLVNGSTGVVTGFVDKKRDGSHLTTLPLPVVRFDSGLEVTVDLERWDVMEGETVLATRKQIPLILAWALSIHKCQGMTIDSLHTDLSRAFGCGMVYVALSRVRSVEGLRLSGFDSRKIRAHPKVLKFYGRLLGCR